MSVYLLSAGADGKTLDELEQKLKPAIPELKRIDRIEDIGKPSIKSGERSFVMLAAPAAEQDFARLVDTVNRNHKDLFFIAIGGEISARDYKRLIQSGNADWVAGSGLPQEVLDILGRVGAAAREGFAPHQPIVVSFVPSAGGVGNSTLAIETAIQLVSRKVAKDGKIALIDLDFQSSHVCDYLDIAPKFQVEEIIAAPDRLDDHLLGVFASRHSSGLEVFAAPRNQLQMRELGLDALSALFDRVARHYAFIIVDLPLGANVWTIPLLTASEGILVTGVKFAPCVPRAVSARTFGRWSIDANSACSAAWSEPTMSRASSAMKSGCSSGTLASRLNA